MHKPSKKPLNNILSVKNLSVTQDSTEILKNISFDIQKGDILAIIGPNGSGKTTLMKAILGLIPYTGKVTILKKPVSFILKKIAYVPQRFSFDRSFPLTVYEFLSLKAKKKEIIDALSQVGASSFFEKQIGTLSGGQLQRVLIAQALLKNPEILFLDEPTSGIDISGETSFYELIKELNKKNNLTIVFISHEINMVYKFATNIICVNKDLVCFGKPKEAVTKKILNKLYGENISFRQHSH